MNWSAGSHGHSSDSTVVDLKDAGLESGSKFGFGSPNIARSTHIKVPGLSLYTTKTPTIQVRFYLAIKAKTESSFVKDPELSLPVATYRIGQSPTTAIGEPPSAAGDEIGDSDTDGDDEGGVLTTTAVAYNPNPDFQVILIDPASVSVIETPESGNKPQVIGIRI